jgi:hypothetical protein
MTERVMHIGGVCAAVLHEAGTAGTDAALGLFHQRLELVCVAAVRLETEHDAARIAIEVHPVEALDQVAQALELHRQRIQRLRAQVFELDVTLGPAQCDAPGSALE